MLSNNNIIPEQQLMHLLKRYASNPQKFHYIQESICSLITFKHLSHQYEKNHLCRNSQDKNTDLSFNLSINLSWSSLIIKSIQKQLTEEELIQKLHEAFCNIDATNNTKYQNLFREINLYKNNLIFSESNFIINIMLIINQVPINNLNKLFQSIIAEYQKWKLDHTQMAKNLDFFDNLIPELVMVESILNANIYDMTCDNDMGLILNKIVTKIETDSHQKFQGNLYGSCIIKNDYDDNNSLFAKCNPKGLNLARMNLLLKNQELISVDIENKNFNFPQLELIICDGNVLEKYYKEFFPHRKRGGIFQKNIYPMILNLLSFKGKIIIFGNENILNSLNQDLKYYKDIFM